MAAIPYLIRKSEAIISLAPTAQFIVDGDVVTWLDDSVTEPTSAAIDTEVIRLQAEYDSQEYARNRKAEYDQLNQFEMQFDDDRDSTTTWVDKINEIKGRHPK
jgi:hypothetical protein